MKSQLREKLEAADYAGISELAATRKRALGVLVSLTFDADPLIAWRAVEAMGVAAERIARDNPEFVQGHLRKPHWLLSEESGGICRHAPQAMAEIVRRQPRLFAEYAPITASLIEDMAVEDLDSGFRAAVLWAIGRLAPGFPDAVDPVLPAVESCLGDSDPQVRGTALWCLIEAGKKDRFAGRDDLAEDGGPVRIFENGNFTDTTVAELTRA